MSKIRELIDKANSGTSKQWISVDQAEKLLEQVIRECATIADKNSPMSYPDHGIKIKRYFGVER